MAKRLVAYFSASSTTKKVAEMLAEAAKADLYEIEPKVPYTRADLDWMNKKSRSSVEMNDKKIRPEIAEENLDMSAYDEILLGFPAATTGIFIMQKRAVDRFWSALPDVVTIRKKVKKPSR